MRRMVSLTLGNLADLPMPCRECIFWESEPAAAEQASRAGTTALEKEAWLSQTLLQWGTCGYLAYVDDAAAGYAIFAPPAFVPRSTSFPTSPVAADAVLLMTVRTLPPYAGAGLGRMLVQTVARDVVRRGIRAIEAFGRDGTGSTTGTGDPALAPPGCVLPADFLRSVGFKTVRPHPRTPRMRLDIRSTVTWRAEMETALERLFGSLPTAAPAR